LVPGLGHRVPAPLAGQRPVGWGDRRDAEPTQLDHCRDIAATPVATLSRVLGPAAGRHLSIWPGGVTRAWSRVSCHPQYRRRGDLRDRRRRRHRHPGTAAARRQSLRGCGPAVWVATVQLKVRSAGYHHHHPIAHIRTH
jgi:hypothetical protein